MLIIDRSSSSGDLHGDWGSDVSEPEAVVESEATLGRKGGAVSAALLLKRGGDGSGASPTEIEQHAVQ